MEIFITVFLIVLFGIIYEDNYNKFKDNEL